MDLSNLPEVTTYDNAVAKIQEIVSEAEKLQTKLSELNSELIYYQGVAKALETYNKTKTSGKKTK